MREPRDNIRSILNRLKLPGDLPALEKEQWDRMSPAWRMIVDCRWLGFEAGNYIEMLARRWNYMADVYLENASGFVLCRYEDFINDKAGEIKRLANQFGLPPKNDISERVDVQYQLKGDRDVSWLRFFGEKNLAAIESVCESRMQRLEYHLEKRQ